MIRAILKHTRTALLRLSIRTVERAGLVVVQLKRAGNATYLVGSNGFYVRFDKVKP